MTRSKKKYHQVVGYLRNALSQYYSNFLSMSNINNPTFVSALYQEAFDLMEKYEREVKFDRYMQEPVVKIRNLWSLQSKDWLGENDEIECHYRAYGFVNIPAKAIVQGIEDWLLKPKQKSNPFAQIKLLSRNLRFGEYIESCGVMFKRDYYGDYIK